MSNVIKFDFDGQKVSFNKDGWINATEVANNYGKRLDVWLKTNETKEYIVCLGKVLNTTKRWELIKTQQGRNGGTWLHPKLSVIFARWVSVEFAVQCDLYIDAILHTDITVYENYQNALQALEAAQKEASKCGKGLAAYRWQKPQLIHSVGHWHEQLQLP